MSNTASNGRKVGYMEIMLELWNQEWYEHLRLSKQNLSDGINQALKRKQSTYSPLSETVAQERQHCINSTNLQQNENITTEQLTPLQEVDNETIDTNIPEILEKASSIYNDISEDVGDFNNRRWRTKLKHTPLMSSVACINNVCKQLIEIHSIACTNNNADVLKSLWLLNCVVYSAVVTWLLFKNEKVGNKGYA